jgi:hypothetical protein
MIDEKAAAARVEAMHRAGAENLARALAVERYVARILEWREFDTAYNPEVSTLRVLYRLKGENALKNILGLVKDGAGEAPVKVTNGVATHLAFSGGFSVVVARAEMVT